MKTYTAQFNYKFFIFNAEDEAKATEITVAFGKGENGFLHIGIPSRKMVGAVVFDKRIANAPTI